MKHKIANTLLMWALNAHVGAQTLDIAQARELDLDGLRGLGPATTRRILEARERQPFQDWRDLMRRVPGIGAKKAEQLSQQGLRVQGQAYPPGQAGLPQQP